MSKQDKFIMVCLAAFIAVCFPFTNYAAEKPAVVSPDKAAFNWPPPPKEGQPGFFTVAENGQRTRLIMCCADGAAIGIKGIVLRRARNKHHESRAWIACRLRAAKSSESAYIALQQQEKS